MTKSTQFIIELVQTALSGMSFLSVPSRGWDDDEIENLTKIVAGQGIAPLVGEAIRIVGRENFDDKFVMGVVWHTMVYESKTYAHLKSALGNLARLFEDHGIPFMVMKGFDLGRHYPKPSMRYFTDIDFYNFGQFEQADALVASELGIKVHTDVHHHTTFELGGVHCENHFDFVNVHTHSENVEFEKILKSLAEKDCGRVEIEGAKVLVPSPDFNALFVMRHMASHFAAEKILLRHLIDWSLFVNAEGSRVDWPFVNSVFARFGMKDFSDAISGLCMRYFGMDDLGVVSVNDEKLQDKILDDIIASTWNEEMPRGRRLSILLWKLRRYRDSGWKRRLVYKSSGLEAFVRSIVAHLKKPASLWR